MRMSQTKLKKTKNQNLKLKKMKLKRNDKWGIPIWKSNTISIKANALLVELIYLIEVDYNYNFQN